jgi:hypothetical protein
MPIRRLDAEKFKVAPVAADSNADWWGNNAAFTCPVCSKVFLATSFNDPNNIGQPCPACGKSRAHVTGSPLQGGEAWIEWGFD